MIKTMHTIKKTGGDEKKDGTRWDHMLHWDNMNKKSGTTYHGILGPEGPHKQGQNKTTGLPLRDKLSTDY